jgi:hypothetical protein
MTYEGTVGGLRVIEEGQPPVMIHATAKEMKRFRESNPHARPGQVQAASTANDLSYHGGVGGIGVETAPKVYLVLWGAQWNNNDPSGEAAILENFYRGAGGSSWLNSVTQYLSRTQARATAPISTGSAQGRHHDCFRARDGRDDHRPIPQRWLAGLQRRGERRQVRLDLLGPGRFGGYQSDHRHVRGAVSLEQCLRQRFWRLRPNVSVTPQTGEIWACLLRPDLSF